MQCDQCLAARQSIWLNFEIAKLRYKWTTTPCAIEQNMWGKQQNKLTKQTAVMCTTHTHTVEQLA